MSKKGKQLKMDFKGESPDGVVDEAVAKPPIDDGGDFALRVAKTCHEVNRAYCEGHGDFSQVPWDEAPNWVKESAVKGVKFFVENPGAKPSQMHDSWCEEKVSTGWVYGPEKDPLKKTHPCLVSYRELPYKQQLKDTLFLSVVKSFVTK